MTQPTVAPYKQLRRPLDDRIVAGVCSGIGRYLSVDPVLIRVGFAVLTVMTWGVGLLAYPIAWFLMPEEPAPAGPVWRDPADPAWGQPAGYPAGPAWTQPGAEQAGAEQPGAEQAGSNAPTSTPPGA